MSFRLNDEEEMIEKVVREFARDQVTLETAHDNDRHDRFPEETLQQAAALGLTTMSLPQDAGGAGVSPVAFASAVLELATVCPATASILAVHNQALRCMQQTDALQPALASAAAGGVTAVLVAEESGGSDKRRIRTRAAEADGWKVTGQKAWGLAAAGARHFLVLADTEAGASLFLLDADGEGVMLGEADPIMGLRASGVRSVYFEEAPAVLVGDAGRGREILDASMPWLHVAIAAAICGAVAGCFDAAARFAESRVQFGAQIGRYQAVSDTVTNVDLQLAAARALTFEAAAHLEDGEKAATWAARAKAFATNMAIPATRQCIRVQGGTGFMREGGTERFFRDVRALQFIGEPVQMQYDLLKRDVLDIEFGPTP